MWPAACGLGYSAGTTLYLASCASRGTPAAFATSRWAPLYSATRRGPRKASTTSDRTMAASNDMTIYRADWVIPVSAPAVADGAVAVSGERILGVGPSADLLAAHPAATVVDVGPAIIMPGFVNCHSHIEYSSLRGILDDRGVRRLDRQPHRREGGADARRVSGERAAGRRRGDRVGDHDARRHELRRRGAGGPHRGRPARTRLPGDLRHRRRAHRRDHGRSRASPGRGAQAGARRGWMSGCPRTLPTQYRAACTRRSQSWPASGASE